MLIQVTVNNPDDQDAAVELAELLYQQSMILTILALYLINMRSKQPMILEAILIPLIPQAHQLPSKSKYWNKYGQ